MSGSQGRRKECGSISETQPPHLQGAAGSPHSQPGVAMTTEQAGWEGEEGKMVPDATGAPVRFVTGPGAGWRELA